MKYIIFIAAAYCLSVQTMTLNAQNYGFGYNIGYVYQQKFNLSGVRHAVFIKHNFNKTVDISVGLCMGSGKGIDISESLDDDYLINHTDSEGIKSIKKTSQGISNYNAWNTIFGVKILEKKRWNFRVLGGFSKFKSEAILRPLEETIILKDNTSISREYTYPVPLYHNYSAWYLCAGLNTQYKLFNELSFEFYSMYEHDVFTNSGHNIALSLGFLYQIL
ncbi:MAG: hypothetical protein H6567_02095 [Lewinellaceae bacterium]|nr:hypothetical protein [Lewinellaceae bacterium]